MVCLSVAMCNQGTKRGRRNGSESACLSRLFFFNSFQCSVKHFLTLEWWELHQPSNIIGSSGFRF